jgi:hypothetical protein
MDGYTKGHVERKNNDVLLSVPKNIYFRTRYREMSIHLAHLSEI